MKENITMSFQTKFKILLPAVLLGFGIHAAAEGVSWTDDFDRIGFGRWQKMPENVHIVPKDTLSAANRVLVVSPPVSQQFLASADKFIGGDVEIAFQARKPKTGDLFYYLGFHAWEPWLKSVCWVQIHNDSVQFMVKTAGGATCSRKIGELKGNEYQTLKIGQSTGKVIVEFDGKRFEFDDPKLVSTEPMPLFLSANTPEGAPEPAELRIDYVKVSGGKPEPRLAARKLSAGEQGLAGRFENGKVELASGKSRYVWNLAGGLHWGAIERGGVPLLDPNAFVPCFAVSIDGKVFYSHELTVEKVESGASAAAFTLLEPASGIRAVMTATAAAGQPGEMRLKLALQNSGDREHRAQMIFPIVGSLAPGGDWSEAEYFFPWRGGILGRENAQFVTEYGGLGWMQLMFAVNRNSGAGLYFYPEDATGRFKGLQMLKQQSGEVPTVRHSEAVIINEQPSFELLENQSGLAMAYYYRGDRLTSGRGSESAETLFATYQGGWKEPLQRYSSWMKSHLKPVTKPRWFRDTFTWGNSHPPAYYDEKAGKYVAADRLAGGEHALQLAFWDDRIKYPETEQLPVLKRYQPGDFEVDRSRGGVEALAAEVRRVHEKKTNMTLYIDYRFCWRETKTGKKYGKLWATMDSAGNYPGYTSADDQYLMCFYGTDDWVAYMRDTCMRLVGTLGLDGIYLDELGISFPCYNPGHGHVKKGDFPTDPASLGRALTLVRDGMRSVNPEAALMTEHAGSDYLTQFFDGSWDQTFYSGAFPFVEKYYDENKLCFFRFYFPHFKLAEWGSSKLHAKRNFFNGMGMDLGGSPDTDSQRRYSHVLHENADAVATLTPEPIVPASDPKLLANRFGTDRKVLYTLYNTSDRALTGGVSEPPPWPDGHYVELLNDEPVAQTGAGLPELTVPAGDVAALAFYPVLLRAEERDGRFALSLPAGAGDAVTVCEETDDSWFHAPRGKSVTLPVKDGKSEYTLRNRAAKKVIFKLLNDGYLVDELIVKR